MTQGTQTQTTTQFMAGMEMSDAPPSTEGGGDAVLAGTALDDMLTGTAAADTLTGGYGDDMLV